MASFDRWWTTIESDGCLQKLDKCSSQECSVSMSILFTVLSTTHDQIDNSDLQEGASTLEVDVKKVQEELVKQGARIH